MATSSVNNERLGRLGLGRGTPGLSQMSAAEWTNYAQQRRTTAAEQNAYAREYARRAGAPQNSTPNPSVANIGASNVTASNRGTPNPSAAGIGNAGAAGYGNVSSGSAQPAALENNTQGSTNRNHDISTWLNQEGRENDAAGLIKRGYLDPNAQWYEAKGKTFIRNADNTWRNAEGWFREQVDLQGPNRRTAQGWNRHKDLYLGLDGNPWMPDRSAYGIPKMSREDLIKIMPTFEYSEADQARKLSGEGGWGGWAQDYRRMQNEWWAQHGYPETTGRNPLRQGKLGEIRWEDYNRPEPTADPEAPAVWGNDPGNYRDPNSLLSFGTRPTRQVSTGTRENLASPIAPTIAPTIDPTIAPPIPSANIPGAPEFRTAEPNTPLEARQIIPNPPPGPVRGRDNIPESGPGFTPGPGSPRSNPTVGGGGFTPNPVGGGAPQPTRFTPNPVGGGGFTPNPVGGRAPQPTVGGGGFTPNPGGGRVPQPIPGPVTGRDDIPDVIPTPPPRLDPRDPDRYKFDLLPRPKSAGLTLNRQAQANPTRRLFDLYANNAQTFRNIHQGLYGAEGINILPSQYLNRYT